jgi:hypothetical protein
MLLELLKGHGFEPKNYPQGYGKSPECPHTQLIQICADLAGGQLNPERFCGETIHNARYSEGVAHWLESADYYPETSCVNTNRVLRRQLETVKKAAPKPNDNEYDQRIDAASDIRKIQGIVNEYAQNKEKYNVREQILGRWRRVVFENCHPSKSDEQNHHFRSYESEDELSDEQVIDEAEQLIQGLEKVTGYKKDIIIGHGGAQHCPQSPRMHSY